MNEAVDIEILDVGTRIEEEGTMSGEILVPPFPEPSVPLTPVTRSGTRKARFGSTPSFRTPTLLYNDDETAQRQAELFYLQKQIQSQTPMVIVLEDGETVEGQIEWYDRNSIKVRGRSRTLIYKSAVKYMYKQGEMGG